MEKALIKLIQENDTLKSDKSLDNIVFERKITTLEIEKQELVAKNKELEREKKRIAYDEYQKLDMKIKKMLYLYQDVIAENENLKGENYKVHKDLNDRRKGFLKKVEKENFRLTDLVKQLKELQKECFLSTKYAQGIIYDVQDFVNNDCSTDWYDLVVQLLKKIKPQLKKAYDLNETQNKVLSVDIDCGFELDQIGDSDKSLFSAEDE